MPALVSNLVIEQGTTWTHGYAVTVNSVAPDDDWTVAAQIRARAETPDPPLWEWSTALGNATISAGTIILTLEPDESSAWAWRAGHFDVEITSPAGDITYRVAQGTVTVSPEVTR